MSDSDSDDSDDADPRHEQLLNAIEEGDDALALSIVRGGVDVNGELDGCTLLLMASNFNRVAVVSCLLELGADADKTTPNFSTPLGAAAFYGHQEVVELFVEVGNAQLNKQDDAGYTALHAAAYQGLLATAKYLVARGCSLTVQTNNGRTALDTATQRNYPQLVQFLTSASNLSTNNDYSSLRTLCAPYSTSPFLSRNIARQLRYTTILAARHARRIHDDPSLHTPLLPFLLRLALLPSADNRTPETESQVFRRVLTYVGTGFALPAVVRIQESAKSVGTKRARDEQ
jgi:ankyrin repeat protein